MSFNRLLADQPEPQIAGSAVVPGAIHVGTGAILARGLMGRAHAASTVRRNASAGAGPIQVQVA